MSHASRLRRVAGGVAVAVSVGLALPAVATAAPADLGGAVALGAVQGADTVSRQAAEAIVRAGVVDTATVADALGTYQTAVTALQKLGISPFLYPSVAPGCISGSPLGIAPAVAGAVPGPWPKLTIPGVDTAAVKSGQTVFAFVPVGLAPDGADTTGMQVAWFNLNTLRGGFVPMGTVSDLVAKSLPANLAPEVKPLVEQAVNGFLAASLPFGGVRAVPVDTGKGTVLAAVFGTVTNGTQSCFFLPTIGIVGVG